MSHPLLFSQIINYYLKPKAVDTTGKRPHTARQDGVTGYGSLGCCYELVLTKIPMSSEATCLMWSLDQKSRWRSAG